MARHKNLTRRREHAKREGSWKGEIQLERGVAAKAKAAAAKLKASGGQ